MAPKRKENIPIVTTNELRLEMDPQAWSLIDFKAAAFSKNFSLQHIEQNMVLWKKKIYKICHVGLFIYVCVCVGEKWLHIEKEPWRKRGKSMKILYLIFVGLTNHENWIWILENCSSMRELW